MRRVSVMLYWLSYPSQDSYSKTRDLSELCVTDYYLYKWKGSAGSRSQVGVTLPDLPPRHNSAVSRNFWLFLAQMYAKLCVSHRVCIS